MKLYRKASHILHELIFMTMAVALLALAACSGHGGSGGSAATAVIGPAGGTLAGPDGVQVTVPPGAINQPTEIGIVRSAAGAPAAPPNYALVGDIYEFTPHDVAFSLPVTVRMPVPNGASDIKVFMAGPGQDWNLQNATVANGVAEWKRVNFSWVAMLSCSIPPVMLNDPYWCAMPTTYNPIVSTVPPQALTVLKPPTIDFGGKYGVDQAAILHFESQIGVPGNCRNASVELWSVPVYSSGRLGPKQTISTQSPAVAANGSYLTGIAAFDFPFTHLYNGWNNFGLLLSVDCPGVLYDAQGHVAGWDYGHYHTTWAHSSQSVIIVGGNVAPPTVFYTVSGTVSGLTGSGLVLQNNGGDNLAIAADGVFTFATSVGAGSPYNVTVLSQPNGQTCSVANASGIVNGAAVANVQVNCVGYPDPEFAYITGANAGNGTVYSFLVDAATGTLVPTVQAAYANGFSIVSSAIARDNRYYYAVTSILPSPPPGNPRYSLHKYTLDSEGGLVPVVSSSGFDLPAEVNSASTIVVGPTGTNAYLIGGSPDILQYSIGTDGALASLSTPTAAGSNPRSIAFTPSGKYAYTVDSGEVRQYAVAVDGALTTMSTVTAERVAGTIAGKIVVDPSGKYAYVLNLTTDNISQYAIGQSGLLSLMTPSTIATGSQPMDIVMHPSGRYVYAINYNDGISQYGIGVDGTLAPLNPAKAATSLQWLSFDLSGQYAYGAATWNDPNVLRFRVLQGQLSDLGAATVLPGPGLFGKMDFAKKPSAP